MTSELTTFKRFIDPIPAKELEEELKKQNIYCEYVEVSSGLDNSNFSGGYSKEYAVNVRMSDFERATAVSEELAVRWASDVPADYYLFSFSDNELLDLIKKKFEWSEFDYQLAKKYLPIGTLL